MKPRRGKTIKCVICGKSIYASKSYLKTKRYCSNQCRMIGLQKTVKRTGKYIFCKKCNKQFYARGALLKRNKAFCSKKCYADWNRGKNNCKWVGDKVNYFTLHWWIRKYKGKPSSCSFCGKRGKQIKKKWTIQWANIDGRYKRRKEHFIPLCVKCHRQYDKKKG